MRRLAAVLVLCVFAWLATTDSVACPDGCQSSTSFANGCPASASCVFCAGTLTVGGLVPALSPVQVPFPVVVALPSAAPTIVVPPPDQPPRRA